MAVTGNVAWCVGVGGVSGLLRRGTGRAGRGGTLRAGTANRLPADIGTAV